MSTHPRLKENGGACSAVARSLGSFGPATVLIVAALAWASTRVDWPVVGKILTRSQLGYLFPAVGLLLFKPFLTAAQWYVIDRSSKCDDASLYNHLARRATLTFFWQTLVSPVLAYGFAFHRFVRLDGWSYYRAGTVIAFDQLAEGVSRVLFCGGVFFFAAASSSAAASGRHWALWQSAVVLALVVLYIGSRLKNSAWFRTTVRRLLQRTGMPPEFDEIWSLAAVGACIGVALLKKGFRIASLCCVGLVLQEHNSPTTAVLFLAALEGATLVPTTPGHLGVFEATAAAVYVAQGRLAEEGVAFGLIYHLALYAAATAISPLGLERSRGNRSSAVTR